MIRIRKEKGRISILRKARRILLLVLTCLLFMLNGCLDSERTSLSIDLIEKVWEVKHFNIVSNSKDERTVKEDFRVLIRWVYFEPGSKSDPDRIIANSLTRNKEELDGTVRCAFKDLHKVFKEFEIKIDGDDNYFLDVTKDRENYDIIGNGQYVERDSKKLLIWPKNVKRIEIEMKNKVFDLTTKTSLVKHWSDWVDQSLKE